MFFSKEFHIKTATIALITLSAALTGCTSAIMRIDDEQIAANLLPDSKVPGIASFADDPARPIVVFGIHGMGATPACYNRRVASMLAGLKSEDAYGSPDNTDANACLGGEGVTSLPVCLSDSYTVKSEGLFDETYGAEETAPRIVGSECGMDGATFKLRDLAAPDKVAEDRRYREFRRFGVLTRRTLRPMMKNSAGKRVKLTIDYYAYWWNDDAKEVQAPFVRKDVTDEYRQERVLLNRTIKQVMMNDGLNDAALYTGTMGAVMREGTRHALCLMTLDLRKRLPRGHSVTNPCSRLETTAANVLRGRNVVLMTQSLGSRILFDSLSQFDDANTVISTKQLSAQATAVNIADDIRDTGPLVYMSANQLPLLAVSQLQVTPKSSPHRRSIAGTAPPTASEPNFFQLLTAPPTGPATARVANSEKRADESARRVNDSRIVAFYDPNDMLGYRAGDHLPLKQRQRIFEITQHYAVPWLVFALPQNAHDQSFAQDKGRQIVMCGAIRSAGGGLKLGPDCRSGG